MTNKPDYTKGLKILDEDEILGMVAEFQEQLDWYKAERDEAVIEAERLKTINLKLISRLDDDTLGMQVVELVTDNERLKNKCNQLNMKLNYLKKGNNSYGI